MLMVISVGNDGERLTIESRKIALTICADEMQSSHRISEMTYSAHQMMVLLANHGGKSGGWKCAGCSANWSNSCGLIVAADGQGQCLVIAQQNAYEHWNGKSINAAIEI